MHVIVESWEALRLDHMMKIVLTREKVWLQYMDVLIILFNIWSFNSKDDFFSPGTFHTIISQEIYQVHLVPWQILRDCKILLSNSPDPFPYTRFVFGSCLLIQNHGYDMLIWYVVWWYLFAGSCKITDSPDQSPIWLSFHSLICRLTLNILHLYSPINYLLICLFCQEHSRKPV